MRYHRKFSAGFGIRDRLKKLGLTTIFTNTDSQQEVQPCILPYNRNSLLSVLIIYPLQKPRIHINIDVIAIERYSLIVYIDR